MLGPCTRLERFSALQGKLLQSNSTPKSLLHVKRPTISLQTVQWRPSWNNCLSFRDIVQHRTLPRVPFDTSQQVSACRACWRGSSSWRGCDIDFGRVGVRAVIVSNQASKYLYLSLVAATLDGARPVPSFLSGAIVLEVELLTVLKSLSQNFFACAHVLCFRWNIYTELEPIR